MSEYTPTMDELREAWLTAEFEERDASTSDDDMRAEFDRALAAHDAEVLREAATALEQSIHHLDPARPADLSYINCTRIDAKLLRERADRAGARAGVVAEEPEWEYRIAVDGEHEWPFGPHDEEQGETLEEILAALGGQCGEPMCGEIERRTKAVPAGPWVPVKQEGATDTCDAGG